MIWDCPAPIIGSPTCFLALTLFLPTSPWVEAGEWVENGLLHLALVASHFRRFVETMLRPTLNLDGTLNTIGILNIETHAVDEGHLGSYSPRPGPGCVPTTATTSNRKLKAAPAALTGIPGTPHVAKLDDVDGILGRGSATASGTTAVNSSVPGAGAGSGSVESFARSSGSSGLTAVAESGLSPPARRGAPPGAITFTACRGHEGLESQAYLAHLDRTNSAQRSPSLASISRLGWRGSVGGDSLERQGQWEMRANRAELIEMYVQGKHLRDVREDPHGLDEGATSTLPDASTSWRGVFRQNPSRFITSMTTCSRGEYVATGDRTGRIFVMKRDPSTGAVAAASATASCTALSPPPPQPTAKGCPQPAASFSSPRPFSYFVGRQAYSSVIDPLNSVEVTPNVACVQFLPQTGPTLYLLASNEKVPKLYKMIRVQESPPAFRSVDMLGAKQIGPLLCADQARTVAMKQTARYALHHEYNINSICVLPDGSQFVSSDDLVVKLWCVEYPESSLETYSFRPEVAEEEPKEGIRCCRVFPNEPALLFVATTAGNVHIIDTRQSLRWMSQIPQTFANPSRDADGIFSGVTNSLSDCALSPCGNYIAGRDFMSVCLWDARKAHAATSRAGSLGRTSSVPHRGMLDYYGEGGGMVQRWELHPSLGESFEALYQSDLLFERFDLQFVGSSQVCTGGFHNTLFVVDVADASGEPAATSAIRRVVLPSLEGGAGRSFHGPLPVRPHEGLDSATVGGGTDFGSRITRLTRPTYGSLPDQCDLLGSCGEAVVQIALHK